MHAYVDTKKSEFNNVQWTIEGEQYPMWIFGVFDTDPLLDGSAPWRKDLMWVGIAVNFVKSSESSDSEIEYSQHQLQNEWVSGHKQQQVHRRLHHITQRRMNHVYTQLKQPNKRR